MQSICRHSSMNLRLKRSLLILLIAGAGTGCTSLGAKPWDHDLLAERAMQVDAYPLQSGMDDHIYFSKEASSGGRSFAGGGCGCN
jgi:hypothetical protein